MSREPSQDLNFSDHDEMSSLRSQDLENASEVEDEEKDNNITIPDDDIEQEQIEDEGNEDSQKVTVQEQKTVVQTIDTATNRAVIEKAQSRLVKRKKNGEETEKLYKKFTQQTQVAPSYQKRDRPHTRDNVFIYKPGIQLPDLEAYLNQNIEIRIAKEHIKNSNKKILKRELWGNENYSSNSDAVCLLKHTNLLDFNHAQELLRDYEGISIICKVTKTRKSYNSVAKNGIKSRKLMNYFGHSLKPEDRVFLDSLGNPEDLARYATKMSNSTPQIRSKAPPVNHFNVQTIPEAHFIFNMSNEPALKYSIYNICDKSADIKTWMSYRLRGYTLYIEDRNNRYEISRQNESEAQEIFNDFDMYKVARVKNPLYMDNGQMLRVTVPLHEQYVELLDKDLDWSELLWGNDSLKVREKTITDLVCYKFYDNQVRNLKTQ